MPDEALAVRKFGELVEEGCRWKGAPMRHGEQSGRRIAAWSDLEIRQAGRAILIRVRTAQFGPWWRADETWAGKPFHAIYDWLEEEQDT